MTTTPPQITKPQRGDLLELEIESLAFGGAGVAKRDGYVLFVQGGMPGDTVRAEVTKRKKHYGEALTTEVLKPGPDRIEPRAEHPGAPWQVLSYEVQLREKQQQVEDALRRIGKLDGFELEPIIPAVEQWRYRNKFEYSFGVDDDGELIIGFHKQGRWDVIESVSDCVLASEASNAARDRALAWLKEEGLSAYDSRTNEGFLRNLVVRESRSNGAIQLRLITSSGDFRKDEFAEAVECDGVFWTELDTVGDKTFGSKTELIGGQLRLNEEVAGIEFGISPEAFFQTNSEMANKLYAKAIELADFKGHERVYDLFGGIGTIALAIANSVGEVYGVEIVEEAVSDAIECAKLNQIRNAHFFAGDVRLVIPELLEKAGKPDAVIIDPPRAGLSKKIVRSLIRLEPKKIIYISCNPTTFAPNAAQLVQDGGYKLERVCPVDMFPQTPHIELVSVFSSGVFPQQDPETASQ